MQPNINNELNPKKGKKKKKVSFDETTTVVNTNELSYGTFNDVEEVNKSNIQAEITQKINRAENKSCLYCTFFGAPGIGIGVAGMIKSSTAMTIIGPVMCLLPFGLIYLENESKNRHNKKTQSSSNNEDTSNERQNIPRMS